MSASAFDIKALLLAKHAQHVVLIHFPIALFIVAVAFDFVAQRTARPLLAAAAYYNFTGAAIMAILTVITGIVAGQWALEGKRLKALLLMHLLIGCLSAVLNLPAYRLPIEAVGAAIVALTGHLGGFLSGVNIPT